MMWDIEDDDQDQGTQHLPGRNRRYVALLRRAAPRAPARDLLRRMPHGAGGSLQDRLLRREEGVGGR